MQDFQRPDSLPVTITNSVQCTDGFVYNLCEQNIALFVGTFLMKICKITGIWLRESWLRCFRENIKVKFLYTVDLERNVARKIGLSFKQFYLMPVCLFVCLFVLLFTCLFLFVYLFILFLVVLCVWLWCTHWYEQWTPNTDILFSRGFWLPIQ